VVAAALGQAAMMLATWPLWSSRSSPLTVPLVDALEPFAYGPALLLTALAAAVVPRIAGPLHCALLVLALAGDQLRVQPEVLSLAVLMTLPAFGPAGRQVARWHLAAMWLWAGTHKALSLTWPTVEAGRVATDLGIDALRRPLAVGVPLVEIAVGITALSRRTWPVTRWGGALVHLGILAWLSPLFGDRNVAVWPWNLALAVAAFVLFAPKEPVWSAQRRPLALAVLAVLMLFPATYYWRGEHAYLTHHLYTGSVPFASACGPAGCDHLMFDTGDLRVPYPPEPAVFRQRFAATCQPGDVLTVTRPETRVTAASTTTHPCPTTAPRN
jgi:hypothetical protein